MMSKIASRRVSVYMETGCVHMENFYILKSFFCEPEITFKNKTCLKKKNQVTVLAQVYNLPSSCL